MTNHIKQSIQVTEDEREILKKATSILVDIHKEMNNTPTAIMDEQELDWSIECLLNIALKVEMEKIWSVFNSLSEENKQIVRKEIYQ